jgi:hypothetical protein
MLGLDIEDLLVLGLIAVSSLIIGQFVFPHGMTVFNIPMNWFCFLVVLFIGVPGLMIFKYGKPRGYLKDFLVWHIKPRVYSPHERDSEIKGPYILEENDEFAQRTKGEKSRA